MRQKIIFKNNGLNNPLWQQNFRKLSLLNLIERNVIIMRLFKIISIIADVKSIVDIFKGVIKFVVNVVRKHKN